MSEPQAECETHAADPWREGKPEVQGRYLVEYKQHGQKRAFVADFTFYPESDDPWEWSSIPENAEILRYARINSPHVRYAE